MDYTLKELLDIPRLRELLDLMDEIHSMPSAILDTEGNVLTATGWQEICTKFHRMHPETAKKCLESDRHLDAKLLEKSSFIIFRCPMGLVDSAAPIIIEGQHIGNVFTGQLFMEPPDEAYFINQAHQYGFDEADYLAAMRKVPFFDKETVQKNLAVVRNLAQMLAEQGLQLKRQRKAEEALQETEKMFRIAFDNAPTGMSILGPDGRTYFAVNPILCEMFGYTREEFLGNTVNLVTHPDDVELSNEWIRKKYHDEPCEPDLEKRYIHKDGHIVWGLVRAQWIKNDDGTHRMAIAHILDITKRKLAETALMESEARMRFALEGSSDGIWDLNMTTGDLYLSPRSCEILGYEANGRQHIAFNMAELVHPDDLLITQERLNDHFENKSELFEIEHRMSLKSGEWKWVLTRGKAVMSDEDAGGTRITGTYTDITERKDLEEQLRQSQKMEAIGQLAGGVAHDFNNLLTVIMGYGQLLLMDPKLGERQKKQVEQIVSGAEKAAQLTNGLLTFSRKQLNNPNIFELNEVILQLHKLITRIIGEDIHVKLTCYLSPLYVNIDRGQIEQVVINLATNARDAMKKGGLLTIQTGFQEIDPASSKVSAFGTQGRYAVITVSDTGFGMDGDTLGRIFEPFFTTKEVGKGTGLGLAIIHGIVKQHNGFINVYSEPNLGTTFRVYIPIVDKELVVDTESFATKVPAGGSETILLAEDDVNVRELFESILKSYGYEVILAENGQDAVERFAQDKDRIKLVILDMIMPKMSGAQAHREIRQLQGNVKVLYSSGYTMDIITNQGDLDEGTELIMKPVQPLELLRKVREMLDISSLEGAF
jgi:PAS domain S-box-containing protein